MSGKTVVLTDEEANLLDKIAEQSGMDCWFCIMPYIQATNEYYVVDLEEGAKKLDWKEAIGLLDEGIWWDGTDVSDEEVVMYQNLYNRIMAGAV